MLEKLYTRAIAAPRLRSSPLGRWLDSFVARLARLGYTEWSRRSMVVLAADFGRWMAAHDVTVKSLDETAVDAYVEHRQTQRERRRAAAAHVVAHLRAEGATPTSAGVLDRSASVAHGPHYVSYMRRERGAVEGTIDGYFAVVREFLARRFPTGGVDLAALTPSDIGAYIVSRASTVSPKRVAFLVSALRSFFRFLFVHGHTTSDLSNAPLPSQARHQPSIPRYLSPAEVEQLLATCDARTAAGRRNRAILVLLVRLGLRAGEVAALDLDDIRWKSAEIVVRGKGNVVDRLPLVSEVGEALSSYLTNDRVATGAPTRRVFLRLLAPACEIAGRGAVSSLVRRSLEKAGLRPLARGAHLLRHTLATQMIRSGASMSEIAEVLRHRSPRTSAIYAKVDIDGLRDLAQRWPSIGGSQ